MIGLRERGLIGVAVLGALAIVASSLRPAARESGVFAIVGFLLVTYMALDRALVSMNGRPALVRIAFDGADALFIAAALTTVLPWVVASGVPAFRQDWYLSPLGSQFGGELWQTLSAWQPAELGSATPQAGFHPLLLAWGVLAFAAGSKIAVIAFILAALACAAAFARRAIAALVGGDGPHSIIGGAIFAFSAPAMNKLVAGHTLHIADQALLALTIFLACRSVVSGGRERTMTQIGLALVIALAAPQPQGFIMCALVAVVVALAAQSLAPLAPLLGAIALQMPTALAAVFSPGETYVVKRAVLEWQYAQSAPPALLSSLGGYLARYFESASTPFVRIAAALITAAAALGCVALRGVAAALALIGFLCAFLIMGLYGPLATQLAFLYQSLSIASLFREVYDLAPLLAFAVALGAAQLVRSLQMRFGVRAIVPATLLLAIAISPMLFSAARMVPSAGSASAVRALAALPGDGRILWLPGIYPLMTSDRRGEGYDPLMRTAGAHAVVYANQPIPMEALAYAMLGYAAGRALPVLERLGCSYIVIDRAAAEVGVIPGALDFNRMLRGARTFPSVASRDPHFEIHALPPAAQMVATGVMTRTGGIDPNDPALGDAVMLFDDPENAPALRRSGVADIVWNRFMPGTDAANPARGAVLGRYVWSAYAEYWFAASVSSVIAEHDRFELPAGVLVGNWRTPPRINGVLTRGQSDIALADPGEAVFESPAAFVGERTGPTIFSRRLAARAQGKIVYVRDSPSAFSGRVIGGSVHALVLRERYDPGWRLVGPPDAVHFSADGWANGWIVDLADGATFKVTFGPQRAIDAAEVVVAFGWIALLGILTWKGLQR